MKRVLRIYADKDSKRDIAHAIVHHIPYPRRHKIRDAFDKLIPNEKRPQLRRYKISIDIKEA